MTAKDSKKTPLVAVVGLGYVGLPLAVAFGRRQRTLGFDVDADKVSAYQRGHDPTGEMADEDLAAAADLEFTTDAKKLSDADYLIITVPTPVDDARRPDLQLLLGACATVGEHMRKGATVIFESTVYPGCTEEDCIPVLERHSDLKWGKDFSVAYSPERINPGDSKHSLTNVTKVVGADSRETLERVAGLYGQVVEAGIHQASSIKVAEAAKVIENTQRDLNIALMNELAIIFERLGIDTLEVLEAAGTKWNFLPFRPGLVGGHCIGVDPYYLTYKAESVGYHPEVVLAGRRINDYMGRFIAQQTVKQMIRRGCPVRGSRVAVLGLTFKENCPDLRNSRVADVIEELESFGVDLVLHDPVVDPGQAREQYGVELSAWDDLGTVDALVLAVAHREYVEMPCERYAERLSDRGTLVDVKSVLAPEALREHGIHSWRL
ncbi:MAG: nucleotide sugar dehydrogenase [Gammaproteobacteria bacterium]|nr:MAG: nucleotide sugar dehydrogenase [Gammaproteobacteria bacterium]